MTSRMKEGKPVYLLAGGPHQRRKTHDPLIQQMLRETGYPEPSVAYIGAASGDNHQFFNFIKTLLEQNGAGRVDMVHLSSTGHNLVTAKTRLEQSDVLFFSGGDVELGMSILGKHNLSKLIHRRFQEGAVLAGLSAGSILLAQQWVRWRNPDDDSSAEPFDCLGLVPLICDMHDEDEGWEELKLLLRLRHVDGEVGYGIPASMGLRIHPDNRIEDIGGRVHRYRYRNGRVETIDVP